jgi:hypothetical protein
MANGGDLLQMQGELLRLGVRDSADKGRALYICA